MPLYEHVFMSRQDASAQQVEELTNHLKGVIEQLGGKVAKLEQWGVKSLSYRLRKNRKAHYTFMNLDAPPAVINEIERQERLNEEVIHPLFGYRVTYRRCLELQARLLAKALTGEIDEYPPLLIK